MARFDLRPLRGGGLVLDCQAGLLSDLATRFVVPLLPAAEAPRPAERLNPVFDIRGERFVMVTQFAATVESRELGEPVMSLKKNDVEIGNALDMLLTGY